MREFVYQIIDGIFEHTGIDPRLGMIVIASIFIIILARKKWNKVKSLDKFYIFLSIFYITLFLLMLLLLLD